MTGQENPKAVIRTNIDGIVAPTQRAAVVCKEVIDLYFASLDNTDLSKKPEGGGASFSIWGLTRPTLMQMSDERFTKPGFCPKPFRT
jgi:hypothetical protein